MKPKLALSDNIIALMSPAQRKECGVITLEERISKINIRTEKELQNIVENWLHLRGYFRRSTVDINPIKPEHGWQIHLHRTKRNPILLDILLLGNDGRYLEFELKRKGGKWSSIEQKTLCEDHCKPKFESLEEVIKCVEDWENQKG